MQWFSIQRAVTMLLKHKNVLLMLLSVMFCSNVILAAGKPAQKRTAKPASKAVANKTAEACECVDPWRTYTRPPTAAVEQLFLAARTVDEANFNRLIETIPDIQEYAVQQQPLLSALLHPVADLSKAKPGQKRKVWWEMSATEMDQLRAVHQATLPAKTRMLKLALQRGASVKDSTYEWRMPPLHLAMVFGTPEMVQLLLQHGADPDLNEMDRGNTPIEFALDHEFFVRMTYLPELVSPEQRSEMLLALLAAGAKQPYLRVDKKLAEDPAQKPPRPAADYLVWPQLAWQTRGAEVMEAMSKTGTTPALDEEDAGYSILSAAAQAGNLGGVRWLKTHLPRTLQIEQGKRTIDLWTLAASRALFPAEHDHSSRPVDAILDELIVADLNWEQQNGHSDATFNYLNAQAPYGFAPGSTLLHHLVLANRIDRVKQILAMGAPVEGTQTNQSPTPLQLASHLNNLPMVDVLLAHGAKPLAGPELEKTPLYTAILPDTGYSDRGESPETKAKRHQVLARLLVRLMPEQKVFLGTAKDSPYAHAGRYPADQAAMRQLLVAGIPPGTLPAMRFIEILRGEDKTLATALLKHGLRIIEARREVAYPEPSVLLAALQIGRDDLLEALLQAGASPDHRGEFDKTNAMEWAIKTQNQPAIDLFLAHKARATGPKP